MKAWKLLVFGFLAALGTSASAQNCPYDLRCPYGAGSPHKADSLVNPYSLYGSPYRDKSHTNPNAAVAPRLYDNPGDSRGRLGTDRYAPDSMPNTFGQPASPHSPNDAKNLPRGALDSLR